MDHSLILSLNQILPLWYGFGIAGVLALPILHLLTAAKSRQVVSQFAPEGHQVKQGTPTMGGLIVVVGILGTLLIRSGLSLEFWLVFLFAGIGFVDDFVIPRLIKGKRGLGWKQKLVLELIAALVVGYFAHLPLALFALLILAFSNSFNFVDGLDGLAAGIGLLIFLFTQIVFGATDSAMAAIGALIPFALLNAPPAKVFMGDVGSLPLGALIGWQFVQPLFSSNHYKNPILEVFLPILLISVVLIAEIVPPPLQIFWVKVFKKKLFSYTPIHHAFEKAGWAETRVTTWFLLVQLICCFLAVTSLLMVGATPISP